MTLLTGQSALVTGGSGGIGRSIALRLAEAGANVAVHYSTNEARAAITVDEIKTNGGRAFAVRANLRDNSTIAAMFRSLSEHGLNTLDILVNNAGIGLPATLSETSEELFDQIFSTNVRGTFFVTKEALPYLRDGGSIINISSMVAAVAYPTTIAYSASKAAINAFTRSLAADLAHRKIRVNAVAPGATNTDFLGELVENKQFIAVLESVTAFGRLGVPDDIAPVVEFLASPAGAWVTGQIIQASGGMHL